MRHSRTTARNPDLEDWSKEYEKKGNLEFFADALAALAKRKLGNGGLMVIGLLGQRDLPGHTLRTAQSILRWDMRPSLWSHAFLFGARVGGKAGAVGRAPVWEVTLYPRNGEFPRPEQNGVGGLPGRGRKKGEPVTLRHYQNPKVDANAALLAVMMTDDEAERVSRRAATPNIDRIRYNLWESLGIWQGYLWAQGSRPNPLREGVPIPAASYVELAFEAINLDMTPGASERHSSPEHIWNGACWWHETFATQAHPIAGYYVLRDPGASLMGADE